jgi:heme-degrading monooxygenase HmoA
MPTTIDVDAPVVTLINVFTVAPDRQEELLKTLNESTQTLFTTIPGFRSANFHTSRDGTKVVNYAQWASEQAFQDMLKLPEAQAHMAEIMQIADKAEPQLYNVRSTHKPQA